MKDHVEKQLLYIYLQYGGGGGIVVSRVGAAPGGPRFNFSNLKTFFQENRLLI